MGIVEAALPAVVTRALQSTEVLVDVNCSSQKSYCTTCFVRAWWTSRKSLYRVAEAAWLSMLLLLLDLHCGVKASVRRAAMGLVIELRAQLW